LQQAGVRDGFLDCLKGLAILTVVAGHTFQAATADFDNYWPFRVVYAFHMPMFMFVSGMTAAFFFERHVFDPQDAAPLDPNVFLNDLWKKAQRLLIPFFTWAGVSYALRPSDDFPAYMLKLIRFPDYGLWFLPTLFHCSVGLTAAGVLVIACRRHSPQRWPIRWSDRRIQLAAFVLATFLVSLASRAIPDALGLYSTRHYFPFVVAGLVYQAALPRGLPALLRPLPYVIFLALVPFWYRVSVSPLIADVPPWGHPKLIASIYAVVVPAAGTLAFVDLAGIIYRRLPALLERALAFLGRRSLDVYAIHFNFVGLWPPIIAPTLYSLAISTLLRLNSFTAWIFFGQWQSLLSSWRRPSAPSAVVAETGAIGPAAP
jgi:fucose 4-O-acetylase-like acetyltransferase